MKSNSSGGSEEDQGPLPAPGTPPPSHLIPSQVGDGGGGRGRLGDLPLDDGGRLILAALAHQAPRLNYFL